MPSTFALIPARSGSKGIVDKNIQNLGGYPLLQWSIAASLAAKSIQRTIVSTDSSKYALLAQKFGAETPFLRPNSLSDDFSSDYDFIIHALDYFSEFEEEPDYIVHLRPTTPFRNPEIIDQAVNLFIASEDATSMRSVHKMSESSYKTFEISETGLLKPVGRDNLTMDAANNARQVFPDTYVANGYVDILSVSFIRKEKMLHGDRVIPFLTKETGEIDSEHDLKLSEREIEVNPSLLKQLL